MRRPPVLVRSPISPEQLAREFDSVWHRGPVASIYPIPRILIDEELEAKDHSKGRNFAWSEETRPGKNRRRVVAFAPQVLRLHPRYRLGLAAHEAGHLLLWGRRHSEDDADQVALLSFGVEVTYDRENFGGEGLEVGRFVRPAGARALHPGRFVR